jgi:hypothetical protein
MLDEVLKHMLKRRGLRQSPCNTADRLGVKPFCMSCSIKLLDKRMEYIAFRRHDVNTFSGMDSSVMGRNFDGSSVLPFFCINIVQAFFHSLVRLDLGKVLDSLECYIIMLKTALGI